MGQGLVLPLVIALMVLPVTIAWWRRRGVGVQGTMPPGSTGWPFIGETLSFVKSHHVLDLGDFMAHRIGRYGKVFRTHLLGRQTIVSADPELNMFVLKNESMFGPGWPSSIVRLMGKESISMKTGDEHRQSKVIIHNFFSLQRVRTLLLKQVEETAEMILGSWEVGSVVHAQQEANKFAFSAMVKQLLNMDPGEDIEKLEREYRSFKDGLFSLPINFPGTTFRKALQSKTRILSIIEQKMSERRNNEGRTTSGEGDFLDWLLDKTDYNEKQIGQRILRLLFAGHDTTARAITMAVYFLNACPQALHHLREEHEEVTISRTRKGKALTWEDYKAMEFTQCVINETLRLGGIARVILRRVTKDTQFKEHRIPGGCNMIIHLAALHTDASLYEESGSFNPWRWMNNSRSNKFSEFIPFGAGARLCPGAELARLEMSVFLHRLVSSYTWEIAEPDEPIVRSFVEFKRGLPIHIRAKNVAGS